MFCLQCGQQRVGSCVVVTLVGAAHDHLCEIASSPFSAVICAADIPAHALRTSDKSFSGNDLVFTVVDGKQLAQQVCFEDFFYCDDPGAAQSQQEGTCRFMAGSTVSRYLHGLLNRLFSQVDDSDSAKRLHEIVRQSSLWPSRPRKFSSRRKKLVAEQLSLPLST